MILGSIAFAFIILVVLLLLYLRKKCKTLSDKNKKRFENLKSKIFWNPFIRYTLLNALKLNMSAMTTYKVNINDGVNVGVASFILLVFLMLPLGYSIILYRLNDSLDKEKHVKSFGTLYMGRDVGGGINSKAWLFPLFFFFRRTAFVGATIFLFAYPSMQMLIHQLLTIVAMCYVSWDDQMFETKG